MALIAEDDVQWLKRVNESKSLGLKSNDELPRIARFLDSNLVMNYMNGEPWYDVHPLIVKKIAHNIGITPPLPAS